MMVLVDHCVPRKFVRLLVEWGVDASPITDHTSATAPDDDLMALVRRLDAVFLTVDKDFANIVDYPPADNPGIIIMRYKLKDEAELIGTLKRVFEDLNADEVKGALVVVMPRRYRIRRSPPADR